MQHALAPWVFIGNHIARHASRNVTLQVMSPRAQILLLVLLPVAIVAGLIAAGLKVPMPVIGRDYVMRIALPAGGALDPAALDSMEDDGRPLVVIDPGHGGHDAGASSAGFEEKDLVLGLAEALRDELIKQGSVRVAMTRDDDRYLQHQERYEIARALDADLFLSIHADSAGDASEVEGASIYTLSDGASSRAARRFMQRENAAGRINGQEMIGQGDEVNSILVELSRRRTQQESDEFAAIILNQADGEMVFHPQARQSAPLWVLRAPDIPSVLFESGFISNRAEAQRLASREGRQAFAQVLARSIRVYFARNPASESDEAS